MIARLAVSQKSGYVVACFIDSLCLEAREQRIGTGRVGRPVSK